MDYPPPGLRDADASITMSDYVMPWGRNTIFILQDAKGQVRTKLRGKPLLHFPSLAIEHRDLLKARVIIATYNQHVWLLSPEPWLAGTTKVYWGVGAELLWNHFTHYPGRGVPY